MIKIAGLAAICYLATHNCPGWAFLVLISVF